MTKEKTLIQEIDEKLFSYNLSTHYSLKQYSNFLDNIFNDEKKLNIAKKLLSEKDTISAKNLNKLFEEYKHNDAMLCCIVRCRNAKEHIHEYALHRAKSIQNKILAKEVLSCDLSDEFIDRYCKSDLNELCDIIRQFPDNVLNGLNSKVILEIGKALFYESLYANRYMELKLISHINPNNYIDKVVFDTEIDKMLDHFFVIPAVNDESLRSRMQKTISSRQIELIKNPYISTEKKLDFYNSGLCSIPLVSYSAKDTPDEIMEEIYYSLTGDFENISERSIFVSFLFSEVFASKMFDEQKSQEVAGILLNSFKNSNQYDLAMHVFHRYLQHLNKTKPNDKILEFIELDIPDITTSCFYNLKDHPDFTHKLGKKFIEMTKDKKITKSKTKLMYNIGEACNVATLNDERYDEIIDLKYSNNRGLEVLNSLVASSPYTPDKYLNIYIDRGEHFLLPMIAKFLKKTDMKDYTLTCKVQEVLSREYGDGGGRRIKGDTDKIEKLHNIFGDKTQDFIDFIKKEVASREEYKEKYYANLINMERVYKCFCQSNFNKNETREKFVSPDTFHKNERKQIVDNLFFDNIRNTLDIEKIINICIENEPEYNKHLKEFYKKTNKDKNKNETVLSSPRDDYVIGQDVKEYMQTEFDL